MYKQLKAMGGGVDPNVIFRIADNATIPNDPENKDWKEYQEWLAQGNTPQPLDE